MNSNHNVEDIIPSSKIIEEKRTLYRIIEMIQQSTKKLPDVFESRFKSRQNYIDKYNGTTQLPNQIEYLRIILDTDIILFCIRQAIMKGNKSESKKMEEWKTFPFDGGKIFLAYKQKRFHANSAARDVMDTAMEKLVGNIDPILKSTKLKEPLLVKVDDWPELQFIISDNDAKIKYKNFNRVLDVNDLGFVDKRTNVNKKTKTKSPNNEWEFLRKLAKEGSVPSSGNKDIKSSTCKQLIRLFGNNINPIHVSIKKAGEYVCMFQLSIENTKK